MPKNMLKSESSRSIHFNYDMTEFKKNVEKFISEAKDKSKAIVLAAVPEFIKTASKFTPPNIGRNSIEKKYYTRPILDLIKLVRGQYDNFRATEEDRQQLKNKMKFKVVYTKAGIKKNTAFAYTKSMALAKKAAKIANRGISRVMWRKKFN